MLVVDDLVISYHQRGHSVHTIIGIGEDEVVPLSQQSTSLLSCCVLIKFIGSNLGAVNGIDKVLLVEVGTLQEGGVGRGLSDVEGLAVLALSPLAVNETGGNDQGLVLDLGGEKRSGHFLLFLLLVLWEGEREGAGKGRESNEEIGDNRRAREAVRRGDRPP